MSRKLLTEGVHGGIPLVDDGKRIDPDIAELNEPVRFKPSDPVTSVLSSLLGDMGPGITNKMFVIDNSAIHCRNTEIEFDRYFPKVNLLVKFYSERTNKQLGQTVDDQMIDDITTHTEYAKDHGYILLNVVNGVVERSALDRIKMEVNAHIKTEAAKAKHVA